MVSGKKSPIDTLHYEEARRLLREGAWGKEGKEMMLTMLVDPGAPDKAAAVAKGIQSEVSQHVTGYAPRVTKGKVTKEDGDVNAVFVTMKNNNLNYVREQLAQQTSRT